VSEPGGRGTAGALVAIAALVAGCGSSGHAPSPAAFIAGYRPIAADIASTDSAVARTLQSARTESDQSLAGAFSAQARSLAADRARLVALTPPEATRPAVNSLSVVLARAGQDLGQIANDAGRGDSAAVATLTAVVINDGVSVTATHRQLEQQLRIPSP
jgi:hypothetical protein